MSALMRHTDGDNLLTKQTRSSFDAIVTICAHSIAIRYWDVKTELTDDVIDELIESAEEHILGCLIENYHSGQLVGYVNQSEEQVFGWWEIS